jgi:hypothetical protein
MAAVKRSFTDNLRAQGVVLTYQSARLLKSVIGYRETTANLLREFGEAELPILELFTTPHFVGSILGPVPDDVLISEVVLRKPQFDDESIGETVCDLRSRGWLAH